MEKQSSHHNPILGIIMMIVHVAALSVLYAMTKDLTKVHNMNSNVMVFLYKAAILIFVLPLCLMQGKKGLHTNRIGLHVLRSFLSICGNLCMFYAIKHITLADIAAIQYMEHILLLTIGIVYFNEKASKTKLVVILASFIGALIVIRHDVVARLLGRDVLPNVMDEGFNRYYIFVFLAIIFWALNSCAIKILGRTEKTNTQILYTTLFSCIFAFPVAFMDWQPIGHLMALEIRVPHRFITFEESTISMDVVIPILTLGFLYFLHCATHFRAFKFADISLLVPFEYLRLVFGAALGYWMFQEEINEIKVYGYMLIVGAGLALMYKENRKYKKQKIKALNDSAIVE